MSEDAAGRDQLAVGARELNARIELGDGDVDDGRYGLVEFHEPCDHVHVGTSSGDVFFHLAPAESGEIGAKFSPTQARSLGTALLEAAGYADDGTDADVVLQNDLVGDSDADS